MIRFQVEVTDISAITKTWCLYGCVSISWTGRSSVQLIDAHLNKRLVFYSADALVSSSGKRFMYIVNIQLCLGNSDWSGVSKVSEL